MAKVAPSESSKSDEFKLNDDNSLSLSTIKEKYPHVIGLRYRNKTNGLLRAVRICSGFFSLPLGESWADHVFHCVYDENPVIKIEEKKKYTSLSKYYELDSYDMIVMGIPNNVKKADLNKFFSKFGQLKLCELKHDHKTGRSRGYGFIRYENFDDQYDCINSDLRLNGTEMFLRLPTSKTDDSVCLRRILIGNVTPSVTMIDLLEYFLVFGKISEIFMPIALVPYAFITFEKEESVNGVFKFGESHRVFGGFVIAERMHSKKELDDAQNCKDPINNRHSKGQKSESHPKGILPDNRPTMNSEQAHQSIDLIPSSIINDSVPININPPQSTQEIIPTNNWSYPSSVSQPIHKMNNFESSQPIGQPILPPKNQQFHPLYNFEGPPSMNTQIFPINDYSCPPPIIPQIPWSCPPPSTSSSYSNNNVDSYHPQTNNWSRQPPLNSQMHASINQSGSQSVAHTSNNWMFSSQSYSNNNLSGPPIAAQHSHWNIPQSSEEQFPVVDCYNRQEQNCQNLHQYNAQSYNETRMNTSPPSKSNGETLSLQLVSDVTMRLLKTCNSEPEKKILAKLLLGIIAEPSISESGPTTEHSHPIIRHNQSSMNSVPSQFRGNNRGVDMDFN